MFHFTKFWFLDLLRKDARDYHEIMMERSNAVVINGETVNLCEYIKNRLYFVTLSRKEPKSTPETHFFSIDNELVYVNYYSDFGPLNLGCLYRYCKKLNSKLKSTALGKKQIIHYTSINPQKRANAAFLIASYAVIYLNMTPKQAYKPLLCDRARAFRPFQDATLGDSDYHLYLIDCLEGIYRALQHGFFDFKDFDIVEYEKYEKIQYGDLNWIIPNKFLAFCGPSNEANTGYRRPEHYINYFRLNDVSTIIRLNRKTYNSRCFTEAGFNHYDLYLVDGSVPSISLANKFLEICETVNGAIAVHCKAGLGRTGSLIGAYMMKHYRMTARESIAWLRICRPGSVIGHQQGWMEQMENFFWRSGDAYRLKRHGDGDCLPHHEYGIYSIAARKHKESLLGLPLQETSCFKHLPGSSLSDIHGIHNDIKNPPHARTCYNKKSKFIQTKRNNNIQMDHPAIYGTSYNLVPIPRKNHTLQSTKCIHPQNNRISNINAGDYPELITSFPLNKQMTQGDRLHAMKLLRTRIAANDSKEISKK